MTSPQLSAEQRQQADSIFKRGLWLGGFLVCVAMVLLALAVAILSRTVFQVKVDTAWISGFTYIAIHFTYAFATRQVRRAGLSLDRVERRVVPKTLAQFQGEPVVLRFSAAWLGYGGLVLWGAMLLLLWLVFQRSTNPLPPFYAAFVTLFLVVMCGISFYLATRPLALLMDTHGVKGGKSRNGIGLHRVSWEQIKAMEVQQVFDYKGLPRLRTLVFLDQSDTPRIVVPLLPLTIKPEQVNEFTAKVEAKLTAQSKISHE